MTAIAGDLDTRRVFPDKFRTLASVGFRTDLGLDFEVAAFFLYDGGSVPPPLWPVVGPPFGTVADFGYLAHDWLHWLSRLGNAPCTRLEADQIMLEIHLYCGVDPLIAYGIYTVVRAAGWRHWGDCSPDIPEELDDSFDWFLDG